ncbi:MAG: peptidyl-prolyl cis-trans isomerase [Proteobacteria bacterium]|nr:peptidyl-prolyl cis-trans isomerase [Pseudomonadota bacterium]
MLRRVLREPLTQFLGLALAIFILYGALNRSTEPTPGTILVTTARIEQLSGLFAKTWQRPPTAQELKGLVDDYVKEEIYSREAMRLGLDRDDTVIRRRLRQKMEFLVDAEAGALTPTDADLEAYLKANAGQFRVEPMMAFQQIYLSPGKRGAEIDNDAQAMLDEVRANAQIDTAMLSDETLLPSTMPLTTKAVIGQTFGKAFAEELEKAPIHEWSGPISSSYGLHLVRVTERKVGRDPALSEVRAAVAREWSNAKRKSFEQDRMEALLKRYQVKIEGAANVEAGR